MGEAKRRKKLDPNYGKPKPSEFQETVAQVLVLAVLLGIELWRKDNPGANWKDFFLTQINEILLSPEFAGVEAHSEEDYLKATIAFFLTVLVYNPPVSFSDGQSFHDFLINKVTNTTPEEIASLLNRTREEKIFIRTCAINLATS